MLAGWQSKARSVLLGTDVPPHGVIAGAFKVEDMCGPEADRSVGTMFEIVVLICSLAFTTPKQCTDETAIRAFETRTLFANAAAYEADARRWRRLYSNVVCIEKTY